MDAPRARTATGMVQGSWENGVAAFRGIPFAAPPVGAHRFRAPRPAERWDGIRDVSAFGPPPPQPGRPLTGDDWLTLAVWTPDPGAAGLPVVAWISGGAYLRCSTANPHLNGAMLAAGGAVVVSAHYRTGAEGFAHLHGAPDNRGLLDQVAALRWIQDNVAAFGGDPSNVTVFGQSAGAGSVASLLVMPSASGLFRRAIMQSLPSTFFSVELAADIAAEIGRAPGADQLAELAPQDLVAAARTVTERLPRYADRWGPIALTPTPFSPVVDGEVLPDAPWRAIAAGAGDVELLIGHTRDEFRLMAAELGDITDDPVDTVMDNLAPTVDAAGYRAAYPAASAAELREVAVGDWLMRMPTSHFADAARAGGARVWMYELLWGFGPQGASHSLDTLLVFGTTDIEGEVSAAGPTMVEQEQRLSELMRAECLAFAATGDPGWDRYDGSTTRVYDAEPAVRPYPEERSRRLWRDWRFGATDPV